MIRDGDVFVIRDSSGFFNTFEFDSGPEVLISYDPTNGPAITDGLQFMLDAVRYEFDVAGGTPGVSANTVAIPLPANATFKQLVDAIKQNVGNGVTVSSEGNRMTFSGATVGDFTQMQSRESLLIRELTATSVHSPSRFRSWLRIPPATSPLALALRSILPRFQV